MISHHTAMDQRQGSVITPDLTLLTRGNQPMKTTIPEGIGVHWNERPLRAKGHQGHQSVTFKGNRSQKMRSWLTRAQIKELTKNFALKKTRSRPERSKRNQVIDLDGTSRGRSRTPAPRDDPIVLLLLGDPDDPTPPFTEEIMRANISRRFKMPVIKTYEGIGDSTNHIRTFSNALLLQPVSDALKCRAFPQTLEGQAQWWYSRLPPNSIASFKELSRAFIGQFISGNTHEKSPASLISIEQGKNESLRTHINRFTKEAIKVPDLDKKVAMIALQQGTIDVYFKMSLSKHAPQDMNQLQERPGKYIKADEDHEKITSSA